MRTNFRIKKLLLLLVILIGITTAGLAQQVALKSNLAYWATTTPNIGVEVGLTPKSTLEMIGGLNVFSFSDNSKIKHWLLQPEYRWWFCERFDGLFLGAHLHGGQFNVCQDIPVGRLALLKDNRYQGYFYGGGLGAGYQWLISPRWNVELSAGAGYVRIHYDQFQCATCGTKQAEGIYNYWGLTKLELSFLYFIK